MDLSKVMVTNVINVNLILKVELSISHKDSFDEHAREEQHDDCSIIEFYVVRSFAPAFDCIESS